MAKLEDEVREVLLAAIVKNLGVTAEDVTGETELIEDLGAKSVNLVRITSAIEDEFGAEIPFMEFRRRKTFGEAVAYAVQQIGY